MRNDAAQKVGLPGLEVRASRPADQIHGAPQISAGGEGAAHFVGETERTKILHVAGGALEITTRGFGEEGYGLVDVHHPANVLVMIEVETLERPEDVIRAAQLLGQAVRVKPLAGSFVEAQYASNGTTRRKRSITSPSSTGPSSPAQQSLFTSEKVCSSRTTLPILSPDHSLCAIVPRMSISFISQIANLRRPAQARQINMTRICHIQTPLRDLQFP